MPTATPSTGATVCSRAAVFAASPVIASPRSSASIATITSPVFTPTRTCRSRPSSDTRSTTRSAIRTARSGSSSNAVGAPNTAITPSPKNWSIVPPCRLISLVNTS